MLPKTYKRATFSTTTKEALPSISILVARMSKVGLTSEGPISSGKSPVLVAKAAHTGPSRMSRMELTWLIRSLLKTGRGLLALSILTSGVFRRKLVTKFIGSMLWVRNFVLILQMEERA